MKRIRQTKSPAHLGRESDQEVRSQIPGWQEEGLTLGLTTTAGRERFLKIIRTIHPDFFLYEVK